MTVINLQLARALRAQAKARALLTESEAQELVAFGAERERRATLRLIPIPTEGERR